MNTSRANRFTVLKLLFCLVPIGATIAWAKPMREVTEVWKIGENDIAVHFVYGLVTTRGGAVLAFSEARIGSGGDETPHHVALKRSTDLGASWSETILVERSDGSYWQKLGEPDRRECWANPAALVDRTTGRVFVFYVFNEGSHNGKNMQRYTRNFYRFSDDEGKTWSARVEITDLVNAKADGAPNRDADGKWIRDLNGFPCDHLGRAFHMPGPGHGLQLKDGRLLMQFWNRTAIGSDAGPIPREQRAYGLRLLYSDDSGATWKAGPAFGEDLGPTESRLVEREDGSLYLNARVDGPVNGSRQRAIYAGSNGGMTWKALGFDAAMPAFTMVDTGLISVQRDGRQVLLVSRAGDLRRRINLTISASLDGGETWPHHKTVGEGGANYSDLVELSDGSIGALYGDGPSVHSKFSVKFVRFNLEWLGL